MDKNTQIFDDKSLADIFQEAFKDLQLRQTYINSNLGILEKSLLEINEIIYEKEENRFKHISELSGQMKDYIYLGIKISEQLIKLSSVMQKLLTKKDTDSGFGNISKEEKDKLKQEVAKLQAV